VIVCWALLLGGLVFPSFFLAVCIVDQFVLSPSSHPGHATRIRGLKKCGDIGSASGRFLFSHLCTVLNGFPAGSNPCAKLVCCSCLKVSIWVCRKHPLITGSYYWSLSHHPSGSDSMAGLESGCLFCFGVSMGIIVAGFPQVEEPFDGYFQYRCFPHRSIRTINANSVY